VLTAGEARREKLAAVMARSGAGTAAEAARMKTDEIAALLEALAASANPSYTPQGRPVMAEISLDQIKSRLK
jgi:DNA mismatch repair ATPase MutL